MKHLYVSKAYWKHTQPITHNAHLPLNHFSGQYSLHQLEWNRQKSDPTGWKWKWPQAFPRDQGKLFPTKCKIQWVLKYKGSRGSLGKLIHFPIINLHLKFPFFPDRSKMTEERTQKSSSKCLSLFPSGMMTSCFPHSCSATLCKDIQGFWPTAKPLICTLAEVKMIWKADRQTLTQRCKWK